MIESYVKKQLPVNSFSENSLIAYQSIYRVITYITLTHFVVTLFTMKIKTRWLTHSLMPLQIVVLHSLIDCPLPANVVEFFKLIKKIAFFDLVPEASSALVEKLEMDQSFQDLLRLTIHPQHINMGFRSHSAVENSMPFMVMMVVVLLGLLVVIVQTLPCLKKRDITLIRP